MTWFICELITSKLLRIIECIKVDYSNVVMYERNLNQLTKNVRLELATTSKEQVSRADEHTFQVEFFERT